MKQIFLLAILALSTSAFAQVCQIDMISLRTHRVLDSFYSYGGAPCREGMKECRYEIRLRNLYNRADCVRSGHHSPIPPQPRVAYRVADRDGATSCYMADANGNAYGQPVEPINCLFAYKVGGGRDGSTNCYMSDAFGVAYGMPVDGLNCMKGYRMGSGRDGSYNCYMADAAGRTYGMPVDRRLCR